MIHTVETAALLLELPAATLHAGDVGIFCVGGDMLCKQYYRDPLGVSYLFSLGRDRSGADIVCGPESGKRFICFGHVILPHRVPLPGIGL